MVVPFTGAAAQWASHSGAGVGRMVLILLQRPDVATIYDGSGPMGAPFWNGRGSWGPRLLADQDQVWDRPGVCNKITV